MKHTILILGFLLFTLPNQVFSQTQPPIVPGSFIPISPSDPVLTYTEDFNNLPPTQGTPWVDGVTLPGWHAANSTTSAIQYNFVMSGTTGSGNSRMGPPPGMIGIGDTESTTPGVIEKALGSYTSRSVTGDIYYGARFKNVSLTHRITFLIYALVLEQWADGSEVGSLRMEIKVANAPNTPITNVGPSSTGWTVIPTGTMLQAPVNAVNSANAASINPLDGNLADNSRNVRGFYDISILPDYEFAIRFVNPVPANNGATADLLSIDGFSLVSQGVIVEDPLPVELSSFQGNVEENGVELDWTTSSEIDNAFFLVERSQDGKAFDPIGKVKGNGTSTVSQTYSFTDATAPQGVNYYRLKQVDYNGEFEYTNIIAVETASALAAASLKVLGNPFTGALRFSVNVPESTTATMEVRNMKGQLVIQQKMELSLGASQWKAPINSVPAGIYILTITGKDLHLTKRVLKAE